MEDAEAIPCICKSIKTLHSYLLKSTVLTAKVLVNVAYHQHRIRIANSFDIPKCFPQRVFNIGVRV